MNTFRINTRMERLVPDELSGTVNETYFEGLQTTVDHITGKYVSSLRPSIPPLPSRAPAC